MEAKWRSLCNCKARRSNGALAVYHAADCPVAVAYLRIERTDEVNISEPSNFAERLDALQFQHEKLAALVGELVNQFSQRHTPEETPKLLRSLPDIWINLYPAWWQQGNLQAFQTADMADYHANSARIARVNLKTPSVVWCDGKEVLDPDDVEEIN